MNLIKYNKNLYFCRLFLLVTSLLFCNIVSGAGIQNVRDFTQISGKLGFNPGGIYQKNNQLFYLKFPCQIHAVNTGEDIAKNEVLASKLYQFSGIKAPELFLIRDSNNNLGTGSRIEASFKSLGDLIKSNPDKANSLFDVPTLKTGAVIDAWLANWDVVGTSFDNVGIYTDQVSGQQESFRVDVGGAVLFSGNGTRKGAIFGNSADEWDLFRGGNGSYVHPMAGHKRTNILSAQWIFGKMTKSEVTQALNILMQIDDNQLRNLINQHAPGDVNQKNELVNKLLARKGDLILRLQKDLIDLDDPSLADKDKLLETTRVDQMLDCINQGQSTKDTREIYKYITDSWLKKIPTPVYNEELPVNAKSDDATKNSLVMLAAINTLANSAGVIDNRIKTFLMSNKSGSSGVAAGDDPNIYGLWIRGIFSKVIQKSFNLTNGYKLNQIGTSIGFDFGDQFIYGAAISYGKSNAKLANGSSNKDNILSYIGSVYAVGNFAKNLFAIVHGQYGILISNKSRFVDDISNRKVQGKNRGTIAGFKVDFGYDYNPNNMHILPSIGFSYNVANLDPYTEKYDDNKKSYRRVSRSKSQNLSGLFNIRGNYNYSIENYQITPELYLGISHVLFSKYKATKVTFLERVNEFSLPTSKLPKTTYILGGLMKLSNVQNLNLGFGYEMGLAKKFQSHVGYVNARVEF